MGGTSGLLELLRRPDGQLALLRPRLAVGGAEGTSDLARHIVRAGRVPARIERSGLRRGVQSDGARAYRLDRDRGGRWVAGSRIVGPVIIGADAQANGSYIGPFTSVADGCAIVDSEIEDSIVRRIYLRVHRIEASLIGYDVEIISARHMPSAHRLVLGDHNKVLISS